MTEQAMHPEDKVRHVLGYLGQLRDQLRMANFDVILHLTVIDNEDADETLAHTWGTPNHTTINIELGPNFFDETPKVIRNTLVHELIHAQHRDLDRLWEGVTEENDDVPKSQTVGWSEDYHVQLERFVSWITNRIVDGGHVPEYNPRKKYDVPVGCYIMGEHGA